MYFADQSLNFSLGCYTNIRRSFRFSRHYPSFDPFLSPFLAFYIPCFKVIYSWLSIYLASKSYILGFLSILLQSHIFLAFYIPCFKVIYSWLSIYLASKSYILGFLSILLQSHIFLAFYIPCFKSHIFLAFYIPCFKSHIFLAFYIPCFKVIYSWLSVYLASKSYILGFLYTGLMQLHPKVL